MGNGRKYRPSPHIRASYSQSRGSPSPSTRTASAPTRRTACQGKTRSGSRPNRPKSRSRPGTTRAVTRPASRSTIRSPTYPIRLPSDRSMTSFSRSSQPRHSTGIPPFSIPMPSTGGTLPSGNLRPGEKENIMKVTELDIGRPFHAGQSGVLPQRHRSHLRDDAAGALSPQDQLLQSGLCRQAQQLCVQGGPAGDDVQGSHRIGLFPGVGYLLRPLLLFRHPAVHPAHRPAQPPAEGAAPSGGVHPGGLPQQRGPAGGRLPGEPIWQRRGGQPGDHRGQ